MTPKTFSTEELTALKTQMKLWARELGFSKIGIADTDLSQAETRLIEWLADGRHSDMHYMAKHGDCLLYTSDAADNDTTGQY